MLLTSLVATVACAPPPPTAPPDVNRPRYELNVRVTRPFRVVTGDLTVTFTPNRPTDRLVFRLWPNGPLQLRSGSRLEAGPVTSDGTRLRTRRPDPTTLVVHLGQTLASGSHVTVRLPWRLRMPSTHDDRIARFRSGLRLGTFFPLLAWDPRRGWVRDPPARILAESATSPAADFDIRVRVPSGLRTLVSGLPLGGDRWHADAVRDVALAVGRFRIVTATAHAPDAVTVRVGVTKGSAKNPLAIAEHALETLSQRYGPYGWPIYTIVVAPDLRNVGIEYPTLTFFGRSSITRLILDHETAHQWFYSLVGNDQARDPWLDETLATWAASRVGSPERRPRFVPAGARRHVGAPLTYWNHLDGLYYWGVYGEGVSALRSLHDDDGVDCALRTYAARRAYSIAEPGDLLDELNSVIPGAERRLGAWGIRR